MTKVINISSVFERFSDTYSPKIASDLNGQQIKFVRVEGDKCPWHCHNSEDEMFYVLDGELDVMERDVNGEEETVTLHSGEYCVVTHGVEHRVVPHGHVKLMLFEPSGTAHTGDVKAAITLERYERLPE